MNGYEAQEFATSMYQLESNFYNNGMLLIGFAELFSALSSVLIFTIGIIEFFSALAFIFYDIPAKKLLYAQVLFAAVMFDIFARHHVLKNFQTN